MRPHTVQFLLVHEFSSTPTVKKNRAQADTQLQQNMELKFRPIYHLTTWNHPSGGYKIFKAKDKTAILNNAIRAGKPGADTVTASWNPAHGIYYTFSDRPVLVQALWRTDPPPNV
jgi:hypothetical protein